jgi:hypothetical protein
MLHYRSRCLAKELLRISCLQDAAVTHEQLPVQPELVDAAGRCTQQQQQQQQIGGLKPGRCPHMMGQDSDAEVRHPHGWGTEGGGVMVGVCRGGFKSRTHEDACAHEALPAWHKGLQPFCGMRSYVEAYQE